MNEEAEYQQQLQEQRAAVERADAAVDWINAELAAADAERRQIEDGPGQREGRIAPAA